MCRAREAGVVTDDATLDQFASGGSDGDEEPEPEPDEAESVAGDGDSGVEPAVSTYRSAPDGRACADCGSSATELWRDGDSLVCPDCKQWEQ